MLYDDPEEREAIQAEAEVPVDELSDSTRAMLAYARLGFAVLPGVYRSSRPLTERGFHDATTESAVIRRWGRCWPACNIFIACTPSSGLLVLDVDPRNGGDEELDTLIDRYGQLPETPEVLTGGGGRHLYFHHPGGRWKAKLAAGIDIKANGYVVAPPSIHHTTGRQYAWELSSHLRDTPLADVPLWVVRRGLRVARPAAAPTGHVSTCLLARAFAAAGMVRRQIDARRLGVMCPWSDTHTTRDSDSSAVVFAPAGGGKRGHFHCSHSHCADRSFADVLAALPLDAVRCAAADAIADSAAAVEDDI